MTLEELVQICKEYAQLGWAIQEQLDDVLEDTMYEENVKNAFDYIRGWLYDVSAVPDLADEVDEIIKRIYQYQESL